MSEIGDTLNAGSSLLNSVAKRAVVAGVSGNSLPEFTGVSRVNPVVLVEDSLRGQSYIADILHTSCNITSAYYLMAVNMLADVGGVTVMEKLEQLNPNRDPVKYILSHSSKIPKVSMEATGDGVISMEDFEQGLPFKDSGRLGAKPKMVFDDSRGCFVQASTLSCEAQWELDPTTGKMHKVNTTTVATDSTEVPAKPKVGMSSGNKIRDAVVSISETSNLAVGKVLEVNIIINGESFSVPVVVTMDVRTTDSESMFHILSLWNRNDSLKERWHGFRSGELSFWRDLVMMRDIVDRNTKAMAKDRSGFVRSIVEQRTNNSAAAMISGKPSVNTCSSVLVFTTDTLRRAEQEAGYKFDDPVARFRVFEATMTMLIFVVDTEEEMVNIYHRGFKTFTRLHLKELKSSAKGAGPDIGEILKAYQLGRAPSNIN